ncbi:hypothetical protein SELMODRAFT_115258 [Selaginella moellendorffii]|uniref:Pentacotripeptide-repeat region of PRORP domain-containing protein n=1 Tax=Selaginella moellendorffii TaxID=88036 RepID=D8SF13_SELML|nr:hypothetical protein SELMODRAFT_115258 [Selaginella moellendorffii]
MLLTDLPDAVCFVSVLASCSHTGSPAAARQFFVSAAMDYQIQPSKQHYCCVIDSLARSGYAIEARELLSSMPYSVSSKDAAILLGAVPYSGNSFVRLP